MDDGRTAIEGSAPHHAAVERSLNTLPDDHQLTATIVLRRKPAAAGVGERLLSGDFKPLPREQAAEQLGADTQDLDAVQFFAESYGLCIVSRDQATRIVKVAGHARNFDHAFGIKLAAFGSYISYHGPLTVPEALAGVIIAVLGLDDRPVARAHMDGS